jgi:hypothetical protein
LDAVPKSQAAPSKLLVGKEEEIIGWARYA